MRRVAYYLAAISVTVLFDQWIKLLVEARLPMQEPVPLLPFLALFRTYNTGVAFSLFASIGDFGLIGIALLVTLFVAWLASRTSAAHRLAHLGFALIIGGALGNLIDRVLYGHVIDYVLFHTPVWSFAVFNLADAFITIGAALIVADEFFGLGRRAAHADNPSD